MSTVDEDRTLRIGWLIFPPIPGSGGYHNIFRIANLLASFGHENVFFMDQRGLSPEDLQQPERYIRRHFGAVFGTVQPWPQTVEHVDVVLATQWDTFELLKRSAPGVTRAYFVQDFEPFFYSMGDSYLKSEQTYRAGVPCITLGHWLGTFLHEKYGATTYPFDFSVEHHRYFPRPEQRATRQRIIFYARPSTPRRCFDLGVAALALVHRRHPETEIVVFGDHHLGSHNIPFPFTDRGILDHEELAELYASATIGMVLSTTNPSLMPPELMATGCAVVDLDLPTNHYLIQNEITGLLAAPEPQALADAVCRLLEDDALRERLVAHAKEHVRPLSWEHSAHQVEAALLELVPASSMVAPARVDVEHITGEGLTPPLSPVLLAGQRYIPRHDGLNSIAVAIGETGTEAPVLRLYHGMTPDELLIETRPSKTVDGWTYFDFPPLPAVHHQPLYFTLAATAGPRLRFDYRTTGGGSLAYNHVPQPGQLLFRTFYRQDSLPTPVDQLLQEQIEYLATCQVLAAEEQRQLSTYIERLQQYNSPGANWRQRLGRATALVRRGEVGGLLGEARRYIQWIRTR